MNKKEKKVLMKSLSSLIESCEEGLGFHANQHEVISDLKTRLTVLRGGVQYGTLFSQREES